MNNKINAGPSFSGLKLLKTVNLPLGSAKDAGIRRTLDLVDDCRLIKSAIQKTKNNDVNVFTKQVEGTDKFNFYIADGEEAKILDGLEQVKDNIDHHKLPGESLNNSVQYLSIDWDIRGAISSIQDRLLQMHKLLIK